MPPSCVNKSMTAADITDVTARNIKKIKAYKPSQALRICLYVISRLEKGTLHISLPDGQWLHFKGAQDGPIATLHIRNSRAARRLLTGGRLGFCESYLDGDWSSPDIATFFELIILNTDVMQETLMGKKWVQAVSWLVHKLKPNTRRGSKKNIHAHYDIGNDFYGMWLDKSMTYSAALFSTGVQTLQQAQQAKYQRLIDQLNITDDHHVLEIGCGWGGFAEYAAKKTGCKITAVTISEAQFNYAKERITNAKLDNLVEIKLCDYRDMDDQFDRIVSIEMFEAVGEKYWSAYFNTLDKNLKNNGQIALQIITIRDEDFEYYRKSPDYIQRYIFPGGMLPTKNHLRYLAQNQNFTWDDCFTFGEDYGRTLGLWNSGFQKSWPKLSKMGFDKRFKRLWEQYLCYCEAGFRTGAIDVIHLHMSKNI